MVPKFRETVSWISWYEKPKKILQILKQDTVYKRGAIFSMPAAIQQKKISIFWWEDNYFVLFFLVFSTELAVFFWKEDDLSGDTSNDLSTVF